MRTISNVTRYCLLFNKKRPKYGGPGNWNVSIVSTKQLMLGCSVSENEARWWWEYYNTMYPNILFTLVCKT